MIDPSAVLSPEDFVGAWGQGLVRATPASLAGLSIPDAGRRFLIEAGLPAEAAAVGFTFAFPEPLPVLGAVVGNPGDLAAADLERLRVIGTDYSALICIDPQKDGRIVSAGRYRHPPVALLNSSVERLAAFLLVFRDVRGQLQQGDQEAIVAAARAQAPFEIASAEVRREAAERRFAQRSAIREALELRADEARALFAALRAKLAAIDPAAMADPAAVWPNAVAAMERSEGVS
jgi:hypothetical protein